MESVIEVEDLRQGYGSFEAVSGVSFAVARGELFALLGTNGAGKTTTLETVEGLRPGRAGSVRVLGSDPHRERRRIRARLGVMMQDGGLFPDLSVGETVRAWRGLVRGARTQREVLELSGLADRSGVRVRQLSGGQRRRLDLALALTGRPEIVFLDEPTTGMDPQARQEIWRIVRGLRDQGTTVVLTTHYLEEAEQLADRVAIMHSGRIRVAGTVAEVLARRGARVTFRPLPAAEPPVIGGVAPETGGGRVGYELVESVQDGLGELLRWASGNGIELAGLEVRGGSLEDVFLEIAEGV
ncbi:ABC transporter ATP-binding protein [Actinocorallia longicatena]|uniref:ABC transporter ATP-binding protein n=1 Tax=Actinocorallia longicatena TaxID=111803 RepID=A0ABP6QEP5_9ACTN